MYSTVHPSTPNSSSLELANNNTAYIPRLVEGDDGDHCGIGYAYKLYRRYARIYSKTHASNS